MDKTHTQGLHDAHEDERNRYARETRARAFERQARERQARCLNTLVGPRCDHLAADGEVGSDPGIDGTGFSDGVV